MNAAEKLLKASLLVCLMAMMACSGGSDDDDPVNPGNGELKITEVSQYAIWGDELVIKGSGFSTVKEQNVVKIPAYYPGWCDTDYSTDGGDMEIVSASATELRVTIPFTQGEFGDCGPDYGTVEVSVADKKATFENVKFVGPPKVGRFEYHWNWWDMPTVTRIGDSVLLGGGLQGMNARESPYWDKLRLSIDGKDVPIKHRRISNSMQGWAMYLPVKDFGEVNCDEGEIGWNEREMTFKFYLAETDISHERALNVQYLPEVLSDVSVEGLLEVSKLGTLNPEWTVTGKDMYYDKVRFIPAGGCNGGHTVETGVAPSLGFKDELIIGIPLVLMEAPCTFNVILVTPCDEVKLIGSIKINP
ncbi:MAG TPA: hypothetical protein VD816_15115 [Ohtaekwangia sp.]|nr:hypothetical protein [Ohtaekwangia sp.]